MVVEICCYHQQVEPKVISPVTFHPHTQLIKYAHTCSHAQSMPRWTAWSRPSTSPSSAPWSLLVTSGSSPAPPTPAPVVTTPSAPAGGSKMHRFYKQSQNVTLESSNIKICFEVKFGKFVKKIYHSKILCYMYMVLLCMQSDPACDE